MNDNFGFPNIDDLHEESIPLGWEGLTQDAEKNYALLKEQLYPNCKNYKTFLCNKIISTQSNKQVEQEVDHNVAYIAEGDVARR